MTKRMAGKVVLITGAARTGGQGEAEAKLCAAQGASVILTDLREGEGRATAASIRETGGQARYLQLDVSDEENWAQVVRSIKAEEGALHGLVNNAGVTLRLGLYDTTAEDWN